MLQRMFADVEQAIQEMYGPTAQAVLGGLLSVSAGTLASVINGFGSSARILVGTGVSAYLWDHALLDWCIHVGREGS